MRVDELRKTKCKCGALIVWVYTQNGKRMPLDPTPVPDGNVVPTAATHSDDGILIVRVMKKYELPLTESAPRYMSHFTTCPDAGQFRR